MTGRRRHASSNRFTYMRGNVMVLTLTRVLGNFGRRMAFPYASLYLLSLGGDPAQIGLVNAVMTLGGLVLLPIAGYISDNANRVRLTVLSQMVGGLAYLLYVLAPRWEYVAIGSALLAAMTLNTPPESAILADSLAPEDRGKGTGLMNALISLPAIMAPFVAGWVVGRAGVDLGMRFLYGYLMIAYIVGGVFKARFLKDTASRARSRVPFGELPGVLLAAYRDLPALYKQAPTSLRAVAAIVVLSISTNAIAGPFWVVYAVERIGLSAERWGLILLFEAVLLNLAYFVGGVVADRWGRTHCQRAGIGLAMLSSVIFVLSRGFVGVLLSRLLVALAMALFIPANTALIADLVPRRERGRTMAAMGIGSVLLLSPGGGIGGPGLGFVSILPVTLCSLGAGYLYTLDARAPWVVVSVLLAVALGLSICCVRDPQEAHV